MPIDSNPLTLQGKGVVKMCVGRCVDHDGLYHPIDLEVENICWDPWCPINVPATPSLVQQNIFLSTGPRAYELYMPGFADHKLGKFDLCNQQVDHAGSPDMVFNLGKGRQIIQSRQVDDGRLWTHITDVLHKQRGWMWHSYSPVAGGHGLCVY